MVTERVITAHIRKHIKKYDATTNSKCNNPDDYGCQRTPYAEQLRQEALGIKPLTSHKKRGEENRHRYTFRAAEEHVAALQRARAAIKSETGITPSDQAAFEYIFHRFMETSNV